MLPQGGAAPTKGETNYGKYWIISSALIVHDSPYICVLYPCMVIRYISVALVRMFQQTFVLLYQVSLSADVVFG